MVKHEHYRELCAAASIGQATPEELLELERHASECDACGQAYFDYLNLAAQQFAVAQNDPALSPERARESLNSELFERRFFERTLETIAGIVDEHFDAAELFFGFLDTAFHCGLVGDIEQDAEGAPRRELFELGLVGILANGAGNLATFFENQFRQRAAETAADAGDEPIHDELLIGNPNFLY